MKQKDAGKSAQCVDVENCVKREPPNVDCPKLLSKGINNTKGLGGGKRL